MRISYSGLDSYKTCPLKYKFQAIDRISEPKSKEQVFGTLVHATMRFIHAPAMLPPKLEDALNYFSQNWSGSLFGNEVEERAAFSNGVKMIQDYYAKNDPNDFTIVDLESRFAIEIGDDTVGRHVVAGIIDRIDKTENGYEIIDYKTAKKMPSQEKIDHDLQLSIYLKAFLDRYPKETEHLESITVSLYYLRHGVKLSSTRTREQLQSLDAELLSVIADIDAGKFEPVLSPLCDWCGYQKICPLWKHKFAEERKMDSEEARATINDFISLREDVAVSKKKLAELQERILLYMGDEGVERVFGDTAIIGKSSRKTYAYDEAKVREILSPLGRADDVLKIDGIALRKVLGEIPLSARKDIEAAKKLEKESFSLTVKKGTLGSNELDDTVYS